MTPAPSSPDDRDLFRVAFETLERAKHLGIDLKPTPHWADGPMITTDTPSGHYLRINENFAYLDIVDLFTRAEDYADLIPGYYIDETRWMAPAARHDCDPKRHFRIKTLRYRRVGVPWSSPCISTDADPKDA